MLTICIAFFIFLISTSNNSQTNDVMDKLKKTAFIEGDFIIGALFPVHGSSQTEIKTMDLLHCDEIREESGIQQVEAALFAIDKINSDENLLPGMRIGIIIKDECWNELVALYHTIKLIENSSPMTTIHSLLDRKIICPYKIPHPLIGILGTASAASTREVQHLSKLFKIPQISYSTSVSDLKHPYFYLSVVPNDHHKAYVIITLLKKFNWTYISVAYTNGYMGIYEKFLLQEWASSFNICISASIHVPMNELPAYSYAITSLLDNRRAKVIVCFCEDSTINALFREIHNMNLTGEYLIVASNDRPPSYAAVQNYEEQAQGSIMISIKNTIEEEFDEYFINKNVTNNERNPWFEEFWQYHFHCRLNSIDDTNRSICSEKNDLRRDYKQSSKVSYVIKSIYALARGLDQMRMETCKNTKKVCQEMYPFNTTKYMEYMVNLNFSYHDENVNFAFNGSPKIASYDIYNFQKLPDNNFGFVKISEYYHDITEKVDFNGEQFFHNFKFFNDLQFPGNSKKPIKSSCSDPCPPGYVQMRGNENEDKLCCWTCIKCYPNEISLNKTTCQPCPEGLWPNKNKTNCTEVPLNYIQWTKAQFYMAKVFSFLGIVLSFATFIVFWKYRNTPVVKSSTAELCFIILLGSITIHSTTFVIFTPPSFATCGLMRTLPALSISMIYAPLLIKTNRIARLLAISKKKFPNLRPKFMTLRAQVVMTMILITTQVIICSIELIHEPPTLTKTLTRNSEEAITNITCTLNEYMGLYAFAFNVSLILLCTYYAIKTRNIPDNFNEAKFIGFLMYITCLSATSFSLIYHGSDFKMFSIALTCSVKGYSVIVLLFFPKLYILLWAPEKNTREHFTTTTEIRCYIGRSQNISHH